jgi:hypothetical protein
VAWWTHGVGYLGPEYGVRLNVGARSLPYVTPAGGRVLAEQAVGSPLGEYLLASTTPTIRPKSADQIG